MKRRLLADEHVRRVFVLELRANGYDVEWIDGDYELGTSDEVHLERSAVDDRVIVTNDTDFVRLHEDFDHAGIILYSEQTLPVTDFIRGIRSIERLVPTADLRGSVLWLDEWIR